MVFLNKELLFIKNCCYVNFEFILNFMCQVFGIGEETCNCVLCHF